MLWSLTIPKAVPAREAMTAVPGFLLDFEVVRRSVVTIQGHIDFEHAALYDTFSKAIMVAIDALLDGARMPGTVTGCNILNRTDHYAVVPLASQMVVEPGPHRFQVRARSASSAAPGKNGLAKVRPYSVAHVRVEPIAEA